MNLTTFSRPYICASCARNFFFKPLTQRRHANTTTSPRPSPSAAPPIRKANNANVSHSDTAVPSFASLSHNSPHDPPTSVQLSYASHFFKRQPPAFLFSTAYFRDFPRSSVPEVAFLGRSNVGKSSLLNALMGRTDSKTRLAHVSKKPGRTKTMNAFGVGGEGGGVRKDKKGDQKQVRWIGRGGLVVVDMPGYGKGSREEWGVEIVKYLSRRKQLRRAFLLVDAVHGLKEADQQILSLMRESGVPHQIILSKADKIIYPDAQPPKEPKLLDLMGRLEKVYQEVESMMNPDGRAPVLQEILACSSEKSIERGQKMGIDGVRWTVLQAVGLDCDVAGKPRKLDIDYLKELEAEEAAEDGGEEVANKGRR